MNDIALKNQIIEGLNDELAIAFSPYMSLGLEHKPLQLFIERSNDCVLETGRLTFEPVICHNMARRLILWMSHYWYHSDVGCSRCVFVEHIINIITAFTHNPREAGAIHTRYFK